MNEDKTFRGGRDTYRLVEPSPFAFGRASACFRVLNSAQDILCLKEFTQVPITEGSNEGTAEFLAEVAARARIAHPNILAVLDQGSTDSARGNTAFIVMPMCESDLRSVMRGHAFVPFNSAMAILRQVASAIDYAHTNGLIHGDVKPENILFAAGRAQVFLSDFGMSRFFTFTEAVVSARSHPQGGGTTAYLSPEQVEHNKQTPRSDIYSFGAVAFEMLTGGSPIDPAMSPFKQMQAKVQGNHRNARDLNPGLSDAVAAWLAAALAVAPKERPATALALIAGLESGDLPGVKALTARSMPLTGAATTSPVADEVTGRTVPDLIAKFATAKLLYGAVIFLLFLGVFVHWQAAPGTYVELLGYKLWHKAGVVAPSCVALKHLRELDFGSGNKSRFCAGTLYDATNKYDGVLNMPGADYRDAWCYSGDLEQCKTEVLRREAQPAPVP